MYLEPVRLPLPGSIHAHELQTDFASAFFSTRTASATDTEHQTIDIESLTQDERDYYWHACGQLFRTNLLANLAVPEVSVQFQSLYSPISLKQLAADDGEQQSLRRSYRHVRCYTGNV